MALYRHGQFLTQSQDGAFDTIHQPGAAVPHSGIRRGREEAYNIGLQAIRLRLRAMSFTLYGLLLFVLAMLIGQFGEPSASIHLVTLIGRMISMAGGAIAINIGQQVLNRTFVLENALRDAGHAEESGWAGT